MKVLSSVLVAVYGQNYTDQYGDYDYAAVAQTLSYPPIFATIDQLKEPPISCWTCKSASSVADCRDNGYVEQCLSNEQVCEIEVRKRNGNRVETVSTGCKWRRACLDNKRQNFMYSNPAEWQCKPAPWHQYQKDDTSVCRQCCDANEYCGIEFMEEYKKDAFKGKAPLQRKAWRKNNIGPIHTCPIDGQDSKVTVKTVTRDEPNADTDKQQLFKLVSSDASCNFDWVILDNQPGNDFEDGATNLFEFDMDAVHINEHCFHSIVSVMWKDGDCMGNTCDEWLAESVEISVESVNECTRRTFTHDVPFESDDNQLTLATTSEKEILWELVN